MTPYLLFETPAGTVEVGTPYRLGPECMSELVELLELVHTGPILRHFHYPDPLILAHSYSYDPKTGILYSEDR